MSVMTASQREIDAERKGRRRVISLRSRHMISLTVVVRLAPALMLRAIVGLGAPMPVVLVVAVMLPAVLALMAIILALLVVPLVLVVSALPVISLMLRAIPLPVVLPPMLLTLTLTLTLTLMLPTALRVIARISERGATKSGQADANRKCGGRRADDRFIATHGLVLLQPCGQDWTRDLSARCPPAGRNEAWSRTFFRPRH